MSVQSVNSMSLVSGAETAGKGSSGAVEAQGGFASALLGQLASLQKGAVNLSSQDVATIRNWAELAKNGNTPPPDLQQLAALLGKEIPTAAKNSRDIDLEDTLQTLAEVLQQLQQLESAAVDGETSQQVLVDSRQETADPTQTVSDAGQAADAAAMAASMDNTLAESDAAGPTMEDAEQDVNIKGNKASAAWKPLGSNPNAGGGASGQLSDTGLNMAHTISAMLGKEGGEGGFRQDKPGSGLKPDSLLDQIDTQTDEGSTGKTMQSVVAEISKLNQAIRQDGSTASSSQPAMFKHLTDPAWNKELGEKLIWMHKQAIPSAELRLNPEHLGPVVIKIDVSQDQASVAFTTQHAAVKEAIEAAIPRLREMFSGQQLNLADVNVSQQQSGQRQAASDFFQMGGDRDGNSAADLDADENGSETRNLVDEIEAGRAIASNGLLSIFA